MNIVNKIKDSRFKVIQGLSKPVDQVWVGKSWACHQAALQANSEYIIFIDCDVILEVGAIERSLYLLQQKGLDLLTIVPRKVSTNFFKL